MGTDTPVKIGMMAGVLALLIAGCMLCSLRGSNTAQAQAAANPPHSATTASHPYLQPPPAPKPMTPKKLASAGVVDPFQGGPAPRKEVKHPVPDLALVYSVPPVRPEQRIPYHNSGGQFLPPPIGRFAGTIYNSNGQLLAIFEDRDGISHQVHVGDQVGNLMVKTVEPEVMVVVDNEKIEHRLKLHG